MVGCACMCVTPDFREGIVSAMRDACKRVQGNARRVSDARHVFGDEGRFLRGARRVSRDARLKSTAEVCDLDVLVAAAAIERRAGASQVIRAEDGLVEGLVAHRRERQVERIHAASTIRHKDHTERRQVELALPLELQAAAPRGEVDAVAGEHEVLVVDRRRLPVWRQRRIV